MAKGLRLSETWFQRGLWLIAALFAGFLIALGSLVVADLPKVERPLSAEQFIDHSQLVTEQAKLRADHDQLQDLEEAITRAALMLQQNRAATESERERFQAWVATRAATQQQAENSEVLDRTRALDALKLTERQQQTEVDRLDTRRLALEQNRTAHERTLHDLQAAAQTRYDHAVRRQELRVFGLRLLLTLPLLLLALWLFLRKRKSPRWPFVWGFLFFALYAFFVELVPYLPSYGGYLRYLVGLALTVWAGNYAISSLRRYSSDKRPRNSVPNRNAARISATRQPSCGSHAKSAPPANARSIPPTRPTTSA